DRAESRAIAVLPFFFFSPCARRLPLPLTGTTNSFETMDVAFENISLPWQAGQRLVQPRLQREARLRERQAAFPVGKPLPRYFLVSNPGRKNRWDQARSYRLQLNSHAGLVLPLSQNCHLFPPCRYHLAVTQHHENEGVSSSLYVQNDPWQPSVNFENFLRNDESIDKQVGERDRETERERERERERDRKREGGRGRKRGREKE
uniref:Amine oxidase n=1 Tax=Pseudonaja textilis TaxID=8673 RepID=A0A670Z8Q8_PSETE